MQQHNTVVVVVAGGECVGLGEFSERWFGRFGRFGQTFERNEGCLP